MEMCYISGHGNIRDIYARGGKKTSYWGPKVVHQGNGIRDPPIPKLYY